MTAPSPVVVETLAAHIPVYQGVFCSCGFSVGLIERYDRQKEHREHVAQALADAGVLDPDQVREREAAAWDKGFKQGGPMHDENLDDPDAHTRNPYRDGADQ